MAMSHANCTHDRTPAGRRACRNGSSVPVTVDTAASVTRRAQVQVLENRLRNMSDAPIKMTGPVARRMARQAAKADNLRNSTCIQAALHIDAHGGRCACGWSAAA